MADRVTTVVLTLALAGTVACGSKKKQQSGDPAPVPKDGQTNAPVTPPAPSVVVGVAQPKQFNYVYGKGKKAYEQAEKAAVPKKGEPDWAAVAASCEEALAADADHLDAAFLLARARVETGQAAGVAKPLTQALAGDYLAFAPELAEAPWPAFFASEAGAPVKAEVDAIAQSFLDRAKSGLFVVARRTSFRAPKPKGKVQWAATRAELYSYDRETERYLRITHTNHSLAGWLMAPSGDELVYVAYSGLEVGADGQPTLLGWAKIGIIDMDSLQPRSKEARVRGTPRRISVGYRAGDELVVETADADGRWATTNPKTWVLDRGKGRLKKSDVPLDAADVLRVDYDRVRLSRAQSPDVQAEAEATSFRLLPTNITVVMPAGEVVGADGYFWSPDKVHLVVRTMPNPCEDQRESTLYLIDAATGKLKNILRGVTSFETRWVDNDHFVYQDDDGALRLYDVEERTQVGRLEIKGGIGLIGVAAGRGPVCTDPSSAVDPGLDTAGADEEAPPEGDEGPQPQE